MEVEEGQNRFKYQSYVAGLKKVHLPSTLNQPQLDAELGDNESHFYETLNHWRELNLAPAFVRFAQKADPLSASLPLLLHNWRQIIDLWIEAKDASDDEGLKALLDLLQKIAHDLRTTISPSYNQILDHLLRLLTRPISPATLTVLLTTFSSLFKYLLIPSIENDLIEDSWTSIQDTLPKCLPEVQRAMAEVWGAVVRRLKVASREKAVRLMASHLSGIEDATAWVFVSACKSVSQTLHTATPSIISPLLMYHLTCEDPAPSHTLLRRVLTALIHHVKNDETFCPVSDLVLKEFYASPSERITEILSILTSVRSGSRFPPKHFSKILETCMTLPLSDPLVRLVTSVLLVGDISVSMASGRKFLERAWAEDNKAFALRLHAGLAEMGWGGWKMIGLPPLLKRTPILLDAEPVLAARVLASLEREKKLGEVDMVWKQRVGEWVCLRLGRFDEMLDVEVRDVLTLSVYCAPSVSGVLAGGVNTLLGKTKKSAKDAWVAGAFIQALARRPAKEWSSSVDVGSWMIQCVARWGESADVLEGLVKLATASGNKTPSISFSPLYDSLLTSIMSHARPLRLASLRLLSSPLVIVPDGVTEVLKRCLQGEEVSLDVQGVRERVLRIGRVGQVVGDREGADFCGRWLIAQLKVNLRPLWSPAAAALASLSERFGDLIWGLVFAELGGVMKVADSPDDDEGDISFVEEGQGPSISPASSDPWEEERSWRDPSAHKLKLVVLKWASGHEEGSIELARPDDSRFDSRSYALHLLSALSEPKLSSLAEKNNRDLVPFFLSLAGPDSESRLPRQMLTAFLTVFSKFNNPKALHSAEEMHAIYLSFLSHPERALQGVALSCMLTYKSRGLTTYADQLRGLLDMTRWRDELTSLDLVNVEQNDRGEVVGVVVRLLFGLLTEKKARTKSGAILGTLARCKDEELGMLVDLMLQPFGNEGGASEGQKIGFLTLLADVLKSLGPRLLEHWPPLLDATVECIADAQRRLDVQSSAAGEEEEVDDTDAVDDDGKTPASLKLVRSIRQLGLKRFTDFFRCPVSFSFARHLEKSFPAFISPRVSVLDKENTQAPSALLELFYVWTTELEYAPILVRYDDQVLPKVYDCLVATNVKPAVISRVFDMVDRILGMSEEDEGISQTVLMPHVSRLLNNLSTMVERSKGDTAISTLLGQRQIGLLSKLAQYCKDPDQAATLMKLLGPLLRRPYKVVPDKVKADLLLVITNLLPLIPEVRDPSSETHRQLYELLSYLFQSLRARPARLSLVATFSALAEFDLSSKEIARLLNSLNAYSAKRLDEPDFDRRLEAFGELNETLFRTLSSRQWLPILYDMLRCIQDPEELSVRTSASQALRHFVDVVASHPSSDYEITFTKILLPGLKNGLRSKHELVRTEILGVISHATLKCEQIAALQDMRILLGDGDDEVNFFNNIHHLQIHRRTRALRRLADQCDRQPLRNATLNEIILPLIANFIAPPSSVDHHLVNEAISTTGRLARHLTWNSYFSLVQRYLRAARAKDEMERVNVRTLVALLENFHFSLEESSPDDGLLAEGDDAMDVSPDHETPAKPSVKIMDAVNVRLLPMLINFLDSRDSTTEDSTRIPVAVGIANVAKHLPSPASTTQTTRLLTVISQILRSKSQDVRDLIRDALCRIVVILGPPSLPIMIQELRGALIRGPHLHILAYVTHSLLVHVTAPEHVARFDALDDCVGNVAHVSAEVIFGESGKDVQADGFKTKMREVRSSSSKGLDSFAIMAKHITPTKISGLLFPLRSILQETETVKTLQLVDEVLRRLSGGLNANKHLVPAELLTLCHTLITQNAQFLKQAPIKSKAKPKNDTIVQVKRQAVLERDHYANNSFRFVAFGLDLLHTALRRNRFDFKDAATVSRLETIVVAVGNSLYSTNAAVLSLSLKCVAGLIKCPLKSLEKSLPVFVKQTLEIIKSTGNTEAEVVQVALRSLATILRDGPKVDIKEKDLIYLLELISPDLEDHDRQNTVFTMLRAIVARKFVVPEIYDLMEKVSEVMVTSQSPQVQELCRGVLLQFLLDYPQGKGRLRTQMTFLAKNLSYVHESGRKSVLELLGAIVAKFQDGLIWEYSDILFVSLVMVIANDDSAKCKEMAAHLIKTLLCRLDGKRREMIFTHIHSWASVGTQIQLSRVSSQVYGLVLDALEKDVAEYVDAILVDLNSILVRSSEHLQSLELDDEEAMAIDPEWQAPYHTMIALSKIFQIFPDYTTRQEAIKWDAVVAHLLFPHAWVRNVASRLLGVLFAAVPVAPPSREPLDRISALTGSHMSDIAKKMCLQLRSEHLDESLSLQVVKNLFYLGKCFNAIPEGHSIEVIEDAAEFEDGDSEQVDARRTLPWLFSKLSYQTRSAHIARRNRTTINANWVNQPLSTLRWFAAMVAHMDADNVGRFLVHILTPVYRIIEDDSIHNTQMTELKTLATELQEMVQAKVGVTKFSQVYNQIRQGALGTRQQRKAARVFQNATNPEAVAKRKMHRNSIRKDSRKRKNQTFADGRGRVKKRREE